ncbi:MAG: hypothetical protein EHM21_15770 [Chloroflexi bacterium]|nr:MAG: hypothetical protein EHM21_15770 [Chloroflexota bacterium]
MSLFNPGKVRVLTARARDWFFSWRAFPAWLFLLYLILFGVWIPFLGFNWDDWPHSFLARNFGPQGIFRYFVDERPFAGCTLMLFSPLLGGSIPGWQVLSLALRFGAVLAFWWFLITLWPEREAEAALAALVFAIYPVFSQQAQSITYHQLWTQFLLFFLSLGWTVLSIRRPEHFLRFTILAVLALLLNLTITEYFYGVELARLVVIWLALAERAQTQRSIF